MNVSITLLISAACLLLVSLKRIPEGQAYTIYRFGRYRRTLDAGLHWIVPLVERVAHRVSLTGRALQIVPQPYAGTDATATARGTVWFQVLDAARADPDFEHLDEVVLEDVLGAFKRVAERDALPPSEFNVQLKREANQTLRAHGVVVTRCQLGFDRGNPVPRRAA